MSQTVTTPVHFLADFEGAVAWTVLEGGVEGPPVYASGGTSLDGWALLPEGGHDLLIQASDIGGRIIAEFPFTIDVRGVALPTPPDWAEVYEANDPADWKPDSDKIIGGQYQFAEILPFDDPPPPSPPPGGETDGLHFIVQSEVDQPSTDGLVAWTNIDKEGTRDPLNALWTFTFAVPQDAEDVGAYETDFVLVVGGLQYNFSAQYARVPHADPPAWQWDSWASVDGTKKGGWHAVPHLPSGPPFSTDGWHTVTIFYQRVTRADGDHFFQSGGASSNTWLLYAVAQLEDKPMLWNVVTESFATDWLPQVKLQHQIDLQKGDVTVHKWVVGQTLTTW